MTRARRTDSIAAEAAFRARLEELGAVLLEPVYLGVMAKHHVRCKAGHSCYPRPNDLRKGCGPCPACAGNDPATAFGNFCRRLAELGATLLELGWLGAQKPHRCICREGHACSPRPADVQSGHGICAACTGQSPAVAEAKFRARIAEMGGEVIGTYVNSKTGVLVRCAQGHESSPRPGSVIRGGGVCAKCTGYSREDGEARFLARLAELGAVPLYDTYRGANIGHAVKCSAGHPCNPRPGGMRDGGGVCVICAGKSPEVAEAAFRARLAELGAEFLEDRWLGVDAPHLIRCPQGHRTRPTPTNVGQGHGLCRYCAGAEWDVLYVVTSDEAVKFGITSDDPRKRLRIHARHGFTHVKRLATDLPGTIALDTETAIRSALGLAGEKPVRGREYYAIPCLALVLDVADSWLNEADKPAA